ncbi:MAG: TfoX/Sxy family protein [Caldilineaceae bacterium]
MAFDDGLAQRVRETLLDHDTVEKKMFGGLAFMLHGNMCCGIVGDALMVRVGKEGYADALAQPHARPMDFTGRPMKGMVYVDAAGLESDAELAAWVERGATYALSLPPK